MSKNVLSKLFFELNIEKYTSTAIKEKLKGSSHIFCQLSQTLTDVCVLVSLCVCCAVFVGGCVLVCHSVSLCVLMWVWIRPCMSQCVWCCVLVCVWGRGDGCVSRRDWLIEMVSLLGGVLSWNIRCLFEADNMKDFLVLKSDRKTKRSITTKANRKKTPYKINKQEIPQSTAYLERMASRAAAGWSPLQGTCWRHEPAAPPLAQCRCTCGHRSCVPGCLEPACWLWELDWSNRKRESLTVYFKYGSTYCGTPLLRLHNLKIPSFSRPWMLRCSVHTYSL